MKAYAQKAQSVVLLEGRVLCEKLEKLNRQFPSGDNRIECEPLMKLPEKPLRASNVTAEKLQEQIMYELKLNANYKEALLSLETDLEAMNTDDFVIENTRELI
jgi:hypothetical protein